MMKKCFPFPQPFPASRRLLASLAALGLLALSLALGGCGLSKGPGLAPASTFNGPVSIDDLIQRSGEFKVYAFTNPRVNLMLFDRKDDAYDFEISEPILVTRQLTDTETIRSFASDLQDNLSYAREYVQAVYVENPQGKRTPVGYAYLEDPTQLSLVQAENDPFTLIVKRVLELERYFPNRIEDNRLGTF